MSKKGSGTFKTFNIIPAKLNTGSSRLLTLLFALFFLTFTGCDSIEKLTEMFGGSRALSAGSSSTLDTTGSAPAPSPDSPAETKGPIVVKGFLKGVGDSSTFEVKAGDIDELRVSFTLPGDSADFWVKITGEDKETLLDDIKIRKGYDIVLLNGGTFYLTVYSKEGGGNWSATYTLVSDDATTEAPGVGPDSKCVVMESSASGRLDGPGESCEIPVVVEDLLEVTFTYPEDSSDFWVEVKGPNGETKVGDYDLSENRVVTLNGKGTFKLTVYSNYGSGNWSATW